MAQDQQDMNIETILKNPADQEALKGFIDEAVLCRQAIRAQQTSIKDIRTECKDRLGIHPRLFSKLVRIAFNDSFQEEKNDFEELEAVVETLYPKEEE